MQQDTDSDNTTAFLYSLLGKKVLVKLKSGLEYRGILSSVDDLTNMTLDDTEEIVEEVATLVGTIFVRPDNILNIREAKGM